MATTNEPSESAAASSETEQQTTTEIQSTASDETSEANATATSEATASTQTGASTTAPTEQSFNKEALLADLHTERDKRRSLQSQVDSLTTELTEAKAGTEQHQAIQAKYSRLEQFLVAVGGPLSKALDSKSFTHQLFETDTDIKELVADWHKANPTATSGALGGSAAGSQGSVDLNSLLRAAAK